MREQPRIYPYLTSEDGELFNIQLHTNDDITVKLCDMTRDEINQFVNDIKEQFYLLKWSYNSSKQTKIGEKDESKQNRG